jgi:RNA polymerase sigma-70 factor (ECF subfamily)
MTGTSPESNRSKVWKPMSTTSPQLLDQARQGDESAFEQLIEPHRAELHAHCYRMLGSVHDAEDALQEALLRAWRAIGKFEGRSSVRSWLYTIATNTSLNAIEKRPKRVLPIDYGPPSDPHGGPGVPLTEGILIEPYPDEPIGLADGFAAPDARYELRESVELAFVAALQYLPPNQRAALIMREVLGFSAKEVAEALDTSVPSVNSALQRARAAVEERVPEQSQQATMRALGDDGINQVVESYVDAWQRGDVQAVVAMLSEEATFSMPPLASWFGPGREEIATFLAAYPLNGIWKWRYIRTRANGQEALAFYSWDDDAAAFIPFALNVLTLEGDKISHVTAFITRSTEDPAPEVLARMPEQPLHKPRLAAAFENFGLPDRLTD